jgi:hypothetical protein
MLAAGMYPLGFLFGVCSACCAECVCGPAGTDLADWCCAGTHPAEITVRISNGANNGDAMECAGCSGVKEVVVDCESIEGDYVLQKDGCKYLFNPEPNCGEDEFECDPENEDWKIAAFVGVGVVVEVCDSGNDTQPGPDYNICVQIVSPGGGIARYGLAATFDGIPVVYTTPFSEYRQLFSEPNCDLRGLVGGKYTMAGFGEVFYPPEDGQPKSCDTCNSVITGQCNDFFLRDAGAICDNEIACEYDIEILPA